MDACQWLPGTKEHVMRSAIRLTLCITAAATFAPGFADEGGAAASGDKQAPREVTAGESTSREMGSPSSEPGLTRTSLDASPARTDAADSAASRAQEEERLNEIWTAP
jgi:hypothetical protein